MKLNSRYISFSLCIVVMIIIFKLSDQNGDISYGLSNKVIYALKKLHLNEYIPLIHSSISYTIRKIAHITLYSILGIIVSQSVIAYTTHKKKDLNYVTIFIISSIICFIYACLDEFHQTFIAGRNGTFKDVGYDSIGYVVAILIVILINKATTKNIIKS